MSNRRSKWKNLPDGRTVRRNQIAGPWTWWTIEALESPAFRVLSLSAHRVIARIRIEHAQHGGRENGKLPVTFQDFVDFGIHRNEIAPAIREAEALGFIRITQHGVASNAAFRIPNLFALTHLPTDNERAPATDDWRRIKTFEEAEAIAFEARKAPARHGKFPRKARPEKTDLRYGNRTTIYISGRGRGRGGKSTGKAVEPAPAWATPTVEEAYGGLDDGAPDRRAGRP
jgi:hypothetical protein